MVVKQMYSVNQMVKYREFFHPDNLIFDGNGYQKEVKP